LPWDFEAKSKEPGTQFSICRGPKRPGIGDTYFLVSAPAGSAKQKGNTEPIQVMLPAIIHGRPELDPPTLGELADMLTARGVDLLSTLTSAVQELVEDGGVAATEDTFVILLLHIPVVREKDGPVERIAHRAYLTDHGTLELGVALGSLYFQNQKYYKEQTSGILAPASKDDWRAEKIMAIEVVSGLDRPSARRQSGITEEGPEGVLIGAGALGATMLDLWVRGGWGQWSVVDNDHIKPHNLVRHPADASHIGGSKADVARYRHDIIMQGASTMVAIHADACELDDEKLSPVLSTSKLIVDVSTTLEYPRLASTRDDFGRHVSAFVTPRGSDGVLLMEDENRTLRLRTLEAQYYRAVISADWGRDHLDGNLGTFWSGASCRDISVVMPYSRITAHAATLAEQIQKLSSQPEAAIRVWSHNELSGAVAAHSVPAHAERRISCKDIELFIDEGVIAKMMDTRNSHLPNETGGIVLGYYDFNVKAVVVVDALAAPSDSKSNSASFKRGVEGVVTAVAEASRRTADVVGYIGEWHSHPPGCRANPSKDDFFQLAYLALGMSQEGLPAVSLIVGTDGDLQALMCEVR
jgi:integrative and conjugative element protein (TIGR02256 family)